LGIMSEKIVAKFTGQKISKLQWCPREDNNRAADQFISGGYDDQENLLTWWKLPGAASDSSEPVVVNQVPHAGSVTGTCFITPERFATASSTGEVFVHMLNRRSNIINTMQRWSNLHTYEVTNESASCTCIAANDAELVTGGEDGRINVLQVDSRKPVRVMSNADSANIMDIQYLSTKEIVTVNTTGQLKVWDIRKQDSSPTNVMTISGNSCPLLSVDKHPNQPHILVTGHGDGVIGIWDIRQDSSPVTLVNAHEGEVWEVRFHPMYPDNLFTCSEDGSCWFWDGTAMVSEANYTKHSMGDTLMTSGFGFEEQTKSSSVWLYIDANKHRMETFSLLPFNKLSVNTFDVDLSNLICGTDGEVIMLVQDIPVK